MIDARHFVLHHALPSLALALCGGLLHKYWVSPVAVSVFAGWGTLISALFVFCVAGVSAIALLIGLGGHKEVQK